MRGRRLLLGGHATLGHREQVGVGAQIVAQQPQVAGDVGQRRQQGRDLGLFEVRAPISSSVAVIVRDVAHHMSVIVHPPSTTTWVPVMKLASVLRRKPAVLPMDAGRLAEAVHRGRGGEAVVEVADVGSIGVAMKPGRIAFRTRMPSSAKRIASERVRPSTAALEHHVRGIHRVGDDAVDRPRCRRPRRPGCVGPQLGQERLDHHRVRPQVHLVRAGPTSCR